MAFISDFNGVFWIDSPIFRKAFDMSITSVGKHTVRVTIPSNVLNKGLYKVGFIFASEDKHFFENYNCVSFKVDYEEPLKHTVLNTELPYHHIRKPLRWEVSF